MSGLSPGEPDEPGELRPGSVEPGARRWGRLLPLLIAAAVLAGFAGALVGVTASRGGKAREAVTEFMVSMRDGDYSKAHRMLCDEAREAYPDAESLRDHFSLSGLLMTDFEVGEAAEAGDSGVSHIEVELTLIGGDREMVTIIVIQDGGRYLICGL